MIYFDNGATSIHKPPSVSKAMIDALTLGNPSRGSHDLSLQASRLVYQCRKKVSHFFNCSKSKQVIFTSNATEALNLAILGLFKSGDHIITSDWEHNSVLRPLYHLVNTIGIEVSFLKSNSDGELDYNELESLYQENTRAVIFSHISNVTGNILNISKVREFTQRHQLYFILDTAQSAGIVPIDMKDMGIHLLAFTGHKHLLGPPGIGGLCIEGDIPIQPLEYGGSGIHSYLKDMPPSLPERLEAGTLNLVGIAGLKAGLEYIEDLTLEKIQNHIKEITTRFYQEVSRLPNIKVYGLPHTLDKTKHISIISLNLHDIQPATLSDRLSYDYQIATRVGAHCAPLMHQSLGTYPDGCIRFSFGYDNTLEEVLTTTKILREINDNI